jgi:hypothetical protein
MRKYQQYLVVDRNISKRNAKALESRESDVD